MESLAIRSLIIKKRMMSDNAKETSNRAELRDRIIVKATEAFTAHGIKSITMDDIATSLGISKRTLYEVFEDKCTGSYFSLFPEKYRDVS